MKKILPRIAVTAALLLGALLPPGTSDGEEGFYQVDGPCRLAFPADHGPHPGYRTEWWYYTGNLEGADRRAFGFQLTFFRHGLESPSKRRQWPQPASAWRTDEIYLAHAAVSDLAEGRHLQAEKMARPVLSLSGAKVTDQGVTIHLIDWFLTITPGGHRLEADADDFSLALDLSPEKPPVLHGEEGYSRKGDTPERASCYYSFTRLKVEGALSIHGKRHDVKGTSWMDHEFSTAPLQQGVTGWDWFSMQLNDYSEVMIYLLRQKDGGLNAASSGTFVSPEGRTRRLERDDLAIEPLAFWKSPGSGARYPVKWRVAVLPLGLQMTVAARLEDQEMRTRASTGVDYWEGSVAITGERQGRPVEGLGYVELTGYARPFDAPM